MDEKNSKENFDFTNDFAKAFFPETLWGSLALCQRAVQPTVDSSLPMPGDSKALSALKCNTHMSDDGLYSVTANVAGYNPDHITVEYDSDASTLTIQAKSSTQREFNGIREYGSSYISRSLQTPPLDRESIDAEFYEGELIVTAKLEPIKEKDSSIKVKIRK